MKEVTNRGGATFTDHVAGARDVYARACMYHTCVKPSLGPITVRTCANGSESAILEIYFYREKKLWKKRLLAQEWTRT